ncbi:MAG: hypothetical protein RIC56_14865 [Pseudomonadales bacterium]
MTQETDQGTVERDPPGSSSPPPSQSPAPSSDPSVALSSNEDTVASGETVQLSWSGQNVDSCTASGGWSGTRGVQGSATVGPLNQGTTFSLTCSGSGGNAVAMLSVSVLGVISLSWEPPTENVDGSPLNDLAGYRIYYGTGSRDYSDQVAINSGGVTSQDVVLATGSYYFAMTAMDVDGNESGYSNEVVKIVN